MKVNSSEGRLPLNCGSCTDDWSFYLDRQNFLSSVLSELRGHELSAATDPETSIILERLMPSLSDWGRRVIGDSFGDKWEELIRHRFGSHVVQTWMTLAADTLDREVCSSFYSIAHAYTDEYFHLSPNAFGLLSRPNKTLWQADCQP